MSQDQQPIFTLDKIYVKDVSLEVPNAPQIFLRREQQNVELNLNFNITKIEDGVFELVMHGVVDAKIGTDQVFLIELKQAGIFQIRNIPDDQIGIVQNIECPTILFPFLREAVVELTTKAGFMPVILAPVNFAYLHHQKMQQGDVEIKPQNVTTH